MCESVEKYQKYAEYKNSESEWLGEIPENWTTSYVGIVSDVIDPQPDHRAPIICENGEGFPYIGIRDVNKDGTLNFETARPVEEGAVIKQEKSFKIEPHNIIFCKVGTLGLPRKIMPHGRCALSATLVLIKAKKLIDSQFLLYVLDSDCIVSQTNFLATGSTRAALGIQQIRKFKMPFPPKTEQECIANFLDHETGKIDSLIEKQQQLIQLLKEKRQAVISHAVTKGLNSNVPMKDSGVEWLGQVPEHWTVSKLKYFASMQGGFAFSSDLFIEEGTQVLRIGNVYQNSLSLDRQPIFIASDLVKNFQDFIVKKDDVLMSLTGTLGKRDYGFAIKVETDDQYLLNQRVAKISPNKKIDTDFMVYVLWSEPYLTQLYSLPSGTKQANLSNSDVLGIEIVIPPTMEEQKDIARYIKEKLAKFDEMILKAESAIQLMQERRTALISAAVTGKIDVRNWQKPTEAKMEFSA